MDSDGNICPICQVENQNCVHNATVNDVVKVSGLSMMKDTQPNSPKKKIRVSQQNVRFGRGRAGYVGTPEQIEVYDPKYPDLNLVGNEDKELEEPKEKKAKKKKVEESDG